MEIWRDIQGYEGIYQVSNEGRVRSLDRVVKTIRGDRHYKGKILVYDVHKSGHYYVTLSSGSARKFTYVAIHYLVAKAFIPNPNGYTVVHHKDHNPSNNRVENLVWISKGEHSALHNSKKVYQYNVDGVLVKEWKSLAEVERELNYKNQNISACCNGKIKRYKGFKWKYDIV